jgi:hypothetical protein
MSQVGRLRKTGLGIVEKKGFLDFYQKKQLADIRKRIDSFVNPFEYIAKSENFNFINFINIRLGKNV